MVSLSSNCPTVDSRIRPTPKFALVAPTHWGLGCRQITPPVPEGQPDRSLARSDWDSTPRKNRPVGYGMIGAAEGISCRNVRRVSLGRPNTLFERFEISSFRSSNRCANPYGSHRTLRDGLFVGACSRHFVPGYDRTVPPGRFATDFRS